LAEEFTSQQFGATRLDFRIAATRGFIIKPTRPLAGVNPWIWYAPTFIGAGKEQFPKAPLYDWLFKNLLDNGYWIAGVDVGESYGNPEGRRQFTEFYEYIVSRFRLSAKPCLLGQSRGGLMLYNWAEENANRVGCIGGIFPVTNLESWPGLSDPKLQSAYHLSEAQLKADLANHNPIDRLEPLIHARIPMLSIHGDSDMSVPLLQNSFELTRRCNSQGGTAGLEIIRGKGHQEDPAYFESKQLLTFYVNFLRNAANSVSTTSSIATDKKSTECHWINQQWSPRPPCEICFERCTVPAGGHISKVKYSCKGAGCGWSYNPTGGYEALYALDAGGGGFTWARRWQSTDKIEDIYTITYDIPRGSAVSPPLTP
jgi:hypothetical protein